VVKSVHYKTLIYSKEAGPLSPEEKNIGVIMMSRPDVLNAINEELLTELDDLLEEIRVDDEVRAVVIKGTGRAFSVGADLRAIQKLAEVSNENAIRSFIKLGQNVFGKIEDFDKPVIAALHGFVFGGGLDIALTCDIRIASEDAKIGYPEVGLGMLSAWGSCVRLAKIIGRGKAGELILTGKQLGAKEAEEIGLVNETISPSELNSIVMWTAGTVATKAPVALKLSKRILAKSVEMSIDDGNKIMEEAFVTCFKTEDILEGLKATLEKRHPQFKGK